MTISNLSSGSSSDKTTKHGMWLNHYKKYSTESYVYNIKDIWDELMKSPVSINDVPLFDTVIKYCNTNGCLAIPLNNYEINPVSVDASIGTFNDLCGDMPSLRNVMGDPTLYEKLLKVDGFQSAIDDMVASYDSVTMTESGGQTWSYTIPCNGKLIYLEKITASVSTGSDSGTNKLTITANGTTITQTYGYASLNRDCNLLSATDIVISWNGSEYYQRNPVFTYKIID